MRFRTLVQDTDLSHRGYLNGRYRKPLFRSHTTYDLHSDEDRADIPGIIPLHQLTLGVV